MHFTQTIFAALLAATSALAAPAAVEKSMMATDIPDWTFEGVKRNCDSADNQCVVEFQINPKRFSRTYVRFITNRNGGTGASQSNGAAQNFGDYTVTSGWSGQFGPNNGFTTFAVVDNKDRLIAYPSYTDAQFANGRVVSPDQSYKPQNLS
ncbi:hypothetical protein E4U17_004229 [Claviceps sp. LM77 group G4]|nr:hypothetical protein E4U17_004229 [Claviceps sp. LM77 group G4]KAG6070296.1 hypothetical protein E4U33_004268 [Claviceps sp. LM78 group G4]KAG6073701.1 hypothetical protein E4U16_004537 [Claviceps sp. LM84 group G4]